MACRTARHKHSVCPLFQTKIRIMLAHLVKWMCLFCLCRSWFSELQILAACSWHTDVNGALSSRHGEFALCLHRESFIYNADEYPRERKRSRTIHTLTAYQMEQHRRSSRVKLHDYKSNKLMGHLFFGTVAYYPDENNHHSFFLQFKLFI